MAFGIVNTYDIGKCTGPFKCENLQHYGPTVPRSKVPQEKNDNLLGRKHGQYCLIFWDAKWEGDWDVHFEKHNIPSPKDGSALGRWARHVSLQNLCLTRSCLCNAFQRASGSIFLHFGSLASFLITLHCLCQCWTAGPPIFWRRWEASFCGAFCQELHSLYFAPAHED